MRRTVQILPTLQTKKIAVFKSIPESGVERETEPIVVAWLKPGDKLKTDENQITLYGGFMADDLYAKVYYNGQEGWILSEAITEVRAHG